MGSSPRRRIPLLGIAHPDMGKYFQVLKVHRGIKHIQDLSCEKARFCLYCVMLNFGHKSFYICNEKEL